MKILHIGNTSGIKKYQKLNWRKRNQPCSAHTLVDENFNQTEIKYFVKKVIGHSGVEVVLRRWYRLDYYIGHYVWLWICDNLRKIINK